MTLCPARQRHRTTRRNPWLPRCRTSALTVREAPSRATSVSGSHSWTNRRTLDIWRLSEKLSSRLTSRLGTLSVQISLPVAFPGCCSSDRRRTTMTEGRPGSSDASAPACRRAASMRPNRLRQRPPPRFFVTKRSLSLHSVAAHLSSAGSAVSRAPSIRFSSPDRVTWLILRRR
jgi:hypothetical protein